MQLFAVLHQKQSIRVTQKVLAFSIYRGAGKSLVQPGRKQVTATEDFDVHISYVLS
jgi:hypothetical protein